jgi:transposase
VARSKNKVFVFVCSFEVENDNRVTCFAHIVWKKTTILLINVTEVSLLQQRKLLARTFSSIDEKKKNLFKTETLHAKDLHFQSKLTKKILSQLQEIKKSVQLCFNLYFLVINYLLIVVSSRKLYL